MLLQPSGVIGFLKYFLTESAPLQCFLCSPLLLSAALLKEVGEFFSFLPNMSVEPHPLELPPGTFIHAVAGLCSRALTAKELPKAFQINANRADSRILLTATAAASVAKVQIAERGGGIDHRCPLTGEALCRIRPKRCSDTV